MGIFSRLRDIISRHFPEARPETVERLLAEILDFMRRRQSAL